MTPNSKNQAKDTGMSMTLIFLLMGLFMQNQWYIKIAILLLIIDMVVPMAFYPLAVVWLTLSTTLGTMVSKILLSLIFFLVVTPVGLVRRLMGKDSLMINQFKSGKGSVFKIRNKYFSENDLTKPF